MANGIRYPMAACLYWPFLYIGFKKGTIDKNFWLRALVPAFFSLVGQIFWALAPYYLEASLIGFLVRSSIVFAVTAAVILFPEERALFRSLSFYVGVTLATVGFITLTLAKQSGPQKMDPTGLWIVLGCSLFFGLYGVSVRKFMQGTNPILSFAVISQPVAFILFALMFLMGNFPSIPDLSSTTWLKLGFTSLAGIGIAHVLYFISIERLGASISSCANLLSPFATVLFASWILGESITAKQSLAGVIIVVGGAFILFAQVKVRERRRVLLEQAQQASQLADK